jgi:hypothetical protein
MPETKLEQADAGTPSHATNSDTYLLWVHPCSAVPRHTNHTLLHRESQLLASHSDSTKKDNTIGAKGELVHAGGGDAIDRQL